MFRVWEWLRKSGWKWLRENIVKAIVLAALTASVTGWLKGTFDTVLRESLPSAAEISCIGREWIIDHSPFRQPEPSTEVFRILVTTLDHDDANRTLTDAVVGAFQGENGIEAIETCRVLKIEGAGKIPVGGSGDFHQRAFELESGFLKGDFSKAFGAQLQAVALATVKPATEERGKYLVEILRPVSSRLEQLIRFPPSGLSARQLADIQFALGLALTTIGEQAGDKEALTEAAAAFRAALEEYTRALAPLQWAMTQNNLGAGLERLGERERGPKRLEEAATAFRAALQGLTRARAPPRPNGREHKPVTALRLKRGGTARAGRRVLGGRPPPIAKL